MVFDAESNGLNLLDSQVWQLSWSIYQGDNEIRSEDRYIFWEDFQIEDHVARMTHFNRYDYDKNSEPIQTVVPEFLKDLENPDHYIVGQNILNFDMFMVAVLSRAIGRDMNLDIYKRVFDTVALSKAIFKEIELDRKDFLAWQYRMMSIVERTLKTNLGFMLRHYDIEYDKQKLHDAVYDNLMCYKVFRKQMFDLDI